MTAEAEKKATKVEKSERAKMVVEAPNIDLLQAEL